MSRGGAGGSFDACDRDVCNGLTVATPDLLDGSKRGGESDGTACAVTDCEAMLSTRDGCKWLAEARLDFMEWLLAQLEAGVLRELCQAARLVSSEQLSGGVVFAR